MNGLHFLLFGLSAAVLSQETPPGQPHFISREAHMKEVAGSTVVLECVVKDLPTDRALMWKRNDDLISMDHRQILPSSRIRITVKDNLPPGERGYELEIDGLTEQDEGTYACEFYIGDKKMQQLSHVTIVVPPTITNKPEDLDKVVIEGDKLELFCNASGKPAPKISWTKLAINGLPGHVRVDGKRLIFSRVARTDSGEYKCSASNGAGSNPASFFDVSVHFKPSIKVKDEVVLTGPKKIARLSCRISASPDASVTWRMKGKPIDDRPNMQQDERYNAPKFELESILTIQAVQKMDMGVYSCYATNRYGNATGYINVTGLPTKVGIVARERGEYSEQFPLTWKVASADQLQKYILMYRMLNGSSYGPWTTVSIDPLQADDVIQHVQSHVIRDLSPDSKYQVKVQAQNSVGSGQFSDIFTFATAEEVSTPAPTVRTGYNIDNQAQEKVQTDAPPILRKPKPQKPKSACTCPCGATTGASSVCVSTLLLAIFALTAHFCAHNTL